MSKKPLLTMAVASMFAGELFLMHANIHDQKLSWPVAFTLWLLFGISAGHAGDLIYNELMIKTNSPLVRFLMLWTIIAAIFGAAFLYAKMVFFFA